MWLGADRGVAGRLWELTVVWLGADSGVAVMFNTEYINALLHPVAEQLATLVLSNEAVCFDCIRSSILSSSSSFFFLFKSSTSLGKSKSVACHSVTRYDKSTKEY